MSAPARIAPTWIGAWAVRAAMVALGLFITLLIMDLFGFGKLNNPFHDWEDFWQCVGIVAGITLMIGLEFLIERLGWVVAEPTPKDGPRLPFNPATAPPPPGDTIETVSKADDPAWQEAERTVEAKKGKPKP